MRHWTPRKHDSFKKKTWARDNVSHCSWPPLYDWLIPWVTMGGKFELADKLFPEAPGAYATLHRHLLPVMHCEINKNLCLDLKYPCVSLCLCMCKYSLHLVYIYTRVENFTKHPSLLFNSPLTSSVLPPARQWAQGGWGGPFCFFINTRGEFAYIGIFTLKWSETLPLLFLLVKILKKPPVFDPIWSPII